MTMATNKIKIGDADKMSRVVESYLSDYGVSISADVSKALEEVSKQAVKQLKSTSPKGKGGKKGHYKNGWTTEKQSVRGLGTMEVTVYNKTKPGLAHLLEFEHNYVSPAGKTTKSNPKPHIQKVDDWVANEVPRRVTQIIQNNK